MNSTVSTTPSDTDDRAMHALSNAGAFCGSCGFEPGERGCKDCESHWAHCVKKLRAAGWAPCSETYREAADVVAAAHENPWHSTAKKLREMADERDAAGEDISPCAAALLPLGTAPVEPCVKRGPHGFHRNAAGWTWTDEDLSDL